MTVKEKPQTPTITQNPNALISSVLNGNQWYNQRGIFNGAINQYYIVNINGNYYVVVALNS